MMKRAYELKLPFAVLLPTDSIQRQKFGKLAYDHGVTVYMLNPSPKFLVNGEKKYVCATSWYMGNLPEQRKEMVEVIWTPAWTELEADDSEDEEIDL